jgi:tRNA threonylcarbamoyladenosine biosynthesis protein TsaE
MAPTTFDLYLPSAEATDALGYCLGQSCPPGTVLLLAGNLGSGKTTLVQGLGRGLGIEEPISSPTFTLINEYLEGRIPLYHVDLYRLDPAQVDSLELETYWDAVETPAGIVAIEWAERLAEPPPGAIQLVLKDSPRSGRQIILMAADTTQIALLETITGEKGS